MVERADHAWTADASISIIALAADDPNFFRVLTTQCKMRTCHDLQNLILTQEGSSFYFLHRNGGKGADHAWTALTADASISIVALARRFQLFRVLTI
jgi:hypothetical protein